MQFRDALFALPQYILPHHALSRLIGYLTRCTQPAVKDFLIRRFIPRFGVNMAEALEENPANYASFNDFFTRKLKPDARPLASENDAVLCPADGVLSRFGSITEGRLIQAKGRDYHRLHMPLAGTLRETIHVPGRLFSVNRATTSVIPNLFARNERVIALFDTDAGPMALILVGAIFVASIETVWDGLVTPPTVHEIRRWHFPRPVHLERGAEMGHFNMGSTIIALFAPGALGWDSALACGKSVRMGEKLGHSLEG